MKQHILSLALLVLLASSNSFAATNIYVIQSDDFQSRINAAAPGDTLVVQAGQYPGNLIFSNPVTVLRSGTNTLIQFQGTVKVQGAGAYNFAQSQFASSVQVQCTGTVSFSQCQFQAPLTSSNATLLLSQVSSSSYLNANLSAGSQTNLQLYDCSMQEVDVYGGKALLKRTRLAQLALTNTALEALRLTNTLPTLASAASNTVTPFVAVQSSFANSLFLSGYKVWLGYNSLYDYGNNGLLLLTNCDAVLVGNKLYIEYPGGTGPAAIYAQGGTLKAYNNLVRAYSSTPTIYGIWLRCSAELVNNTVFGFRCWSRLSVVFTVMAEAP